MTIVFRTESYEQLAQKTAEAQLSSLLLLGPSAKLEHEGPKQTIILYDLPKRRADLHAISAMLQQAERIYCLFGDPDLGMERLSCPSREHFKQLYQFFVQVPVVKRIHLDALARKLQWKRNLLDGMLAIFVELQFVSEDAEQYRLQQTVEKRPLESSVIYSEWKEEAQLATDLLLSSSESLIQTFQQLVTPVTV